MPRSTGWSVLAEKALELGFLTLATRAMERPAVGHVPPAPAAAPPPVVDAPAAPPADPMTFLTGDDGANARVFRARDDRGTLLVAFFADARIRVAGEDGSRLAGMLQNERAELVDVSGGEWSQVYVRVSPEGTTQLEFLGGPYDARTFACEPLAE